MSDQAQGWRQADQILDRLIEADAFAAVGRAHCATLAWEQALARLHALEPGMHEAAHGLYLTAARIALNLGKSDVAIALIARCEATLPAPCRCARGETDLGLGGSDTI